MGVPSIKIVFRSVATVFVSLLAPVVGATPANADAANADAYDAAKSQNTAEAYSRFIAANPGSEFVGAALCDLAEIDLNEAAISARVVYEAGEDPTSSSCVEDGGVTETGAARLIIV